MAGEITQEQVEEFRVHLKADLPVLFGMHSNAIYNTEEDVDSLCDLALLALRQQQDGVWVPREPTWQMQVATRSCGWPMADIYGELDDADTDAAAKQIYQAMLAASSQGRTENHNAANHSAAEAGQAPAPSELGNAGAMKQSAPSAAPSERVGINPYADIEAAARLEGIALGVEAALEVVIGCETLEGAIAYISDLNPADIAAKNPTDARERTEAHPPCTGASEAEMRVLERFPQAVCELWEWTGNFTVWDKPIHLCQRAVILGSGPTEQAAWVDAAGRL